MFERILAFAQRVLAVMSIVEHPALDLLRGEALPIEAVTFPYG